MSKIKVKPDLTIKHLAVPQDTIDDLAASSNYEATGDDAILVSTDAIEMGDSKHGEAILDAVKPYSGLLLITSK